MAQTTDNKDTIVLFRERVAYASASADEADNLKVSSLPVRSWKGRLLELVDGRNMIDFINCSYLGLDQHPHIIEAVSKIGSMEFGVQLACARTRLVSERTLIFEEKLKSIFGSADAITFTSTTVAHLGVLPILASGLVPNHGFGKKRPIILMDKSVHASIQILKIILAKFGDVIKCNIFDINEIKAKLADASAKNRRALILTDGVFSYHGVAPVLQLCDLAEKYGSTLYIDDAHGISITGNRGYGVAVESMGGIIHKNCVLVASLAKGFGTGGASVCFSSHKAAQFIRRHAPTYIFSGPMFQPLIMAGTASANLHLNGHLKDAQKKLWDNVTLFDTLWPKEEKNTGSPSPIRTIFVGDEKKSLSMAHELQGQGILVSAATYPVVPKKSACLRICLSSLHESDQIKKLIQSLTDLSKEGSL